MKNMWGTTSTKYDPRAGTLICSAADVSLLSISRMRAILTRISGKRCSNIQAENITVTVPSGEPAEYECVNLDNSLLDIPCTDPESSDRDTSQG